MIRQTPAVVSVLCLLCLLLQTLCLPVLPVHAQVEEEDINNKPLPKNVADYLAEDEVEKLDTRDTLPGITADGDWKMPGGIMTITGGIGSISGSIKQFGKNSFGIKVGSSLLAGTFNGRDFIGKIILRSKDEDGKVYELTSPLKLKLSEDVNTFSGQYENRRFNKTQKQWSEKKRMDSISFSRVEPIDAQTLADAKAAAEALAKKELEDQSMADGEGDNGEEDGSENGPIIITGIDAVEKLNYFNMQTKKRPGKDAKHLGNIWLRITGENLPVKAKSVSITIDDSNITYTGSHRADPNDEKALQIQVKIAQLASPGPKAITLNDSPGTWDYDYDDLKPRSVDFVRQVYIDVSNPATELYKGEMFFVHVRFPLVTQFKSRKLDLIAGKTKLMELEVTPFNGNKMNFRSKALILPGDKAALAIFEDRKGSGMDTPKDAITLPQIPEGQQLIAIFQGGATDTAESQKVKPYARATVRGLPSNDWVAAMGKAEQCWENNNSSAKSKSPKGYTFTNEIIFTTKRHAGEWFSNTRSLHMTLRDQAACLLIRDEAIKELRKKIQEYNKGDGIPEPKVKNEAGKKAYRAAITQRNNSKRRFAAQMSVAAGRGLAHPLMRLNVSGPDNRGKMTLQDAIKPASLENAYGDAQSIDALNYAVIAIDEAQGVMLGNMSYSLKRLTSLSDCDYEGLLRVCGFGFGSIGKLVKNRMLVPSNEPNVPAGRMVPDRAGYASIDRINTLYQALRAEEAYSRSDTEMAIFVATAPFLYLSVAATAGTTAAAIASAGVVAGELADLGLMASDAYDYRKLQNEEVQFREGLVEVAGTSGLTEVENQASEKFWSAAISGGAALGGAALGEVGGAVLKKFGKSGFEAMEEAVEKAAKHGTKSLTKAEKKLLQETGLFKHLGDQPSPEVASALINGIKQAREVAEGTAKQVDNVQVASAADTGTKNSTDNLTKNVSDSAPTVKGEDLIDTVRTPNPPKSADDLTDTLRNPNPPKSADDLTETLRNPNPPKSADDLTETLRTPNPPKSADDLTDTLRNPNPPKSADDLTDTLRNPNPPKSADDLTDTLRNPNPPKSADDLTDTLRNPNPPKSTDDLTDTLRNPNPPKSADDLTDTLRNPNPPKTPADLTETIRTPKPKTPVDAEDLIGTIRTPRSRTPDMPQPSTPKPSAPSPPRIPADDVGTRLPRQVNNVPVVKPDVPNAGRAVDNVLPTPKPPTDLPNTGSALDVDIDNVVGLPQVASPPSAGSTFTTPSGQQIKLGKKLGQGTFSDVFEIAGDEGNVIKFIRNGEGGEHGLNAWQLALEGKQVSELLDQAGIPQLKVSDVDFTGAQPFMVVEKITDTMQTFDMSDLTAGTRDAMRQAGKWTDAHEQAVVELYHNMAKKNLIWEDGHLENIFFKHGPDGKLVAGVLDHGRIGKWDKLNGSLQNWVKDLGEVGHYGDMTGGFIYSNKGFDGNFKFSSAEEFMVKMLEHKRWIEWDKAANKFKGLRIDPANIDRGLLNLEKYLPPAAKPSGNLPQPFLERWPWREVYRLAA